MHEPDYLSEEDGKENEREEEKVVEDGSRKRRR